MSALPDRIIVINLDRRPERLDRFCAGAAAVDWPFPAPERFAAVDGEADPSPASWQHGAGAWGARQSHCDVLEAAARDGVGCLMVLEDDATFAPTFGADVTAYLAAVEAHDPEWGMAFIGGQHVGAPPDPVAPGVLRVHNVCRLHCYAVRAPFLPILAAHWREATAPIDHALWAWGDTHPIYAPHPRWLAGQAAGTSDTEGGREHPERWWNIAPPSPAEANGGERLPSLNGGAER